MNSNLFVLYNEKFWLITVKDKLYKFLILRKNHKYFILMNYYSYFNQYYIQSYILKSLGFWDNLLQWQYISMYQWLTVKLHFRQKAMWLRVRRNRIRSIIVNINIALRVNVLMTNMYLYKKKRLLTFSNVMVLGINYFELHTLTRIIVRFKPFNGYTLRGIKLARHGFYKKVGKISQYTMFKSKIF